MAKICILIALLLQLLFIQIQGQKSPCPQYFTYITRPGTDETMGRIEIQSPPKLSELHLKVALKITAELPSNYIGRLELAQSKEESAQDVQQGRNLLYNVHFPLHHPIPTLFGIWFNGENYCSGSEPTGNLITTITLEHTLYLPNLLSSYMGPIPKHEPSTSEKPSHGFGNNPFLPISGQPISQIDIMRPTSTSPTEISSKYNIPHNIFLTSTPSTPFSTPTSPKSVSQYDNIECGISNRRYADINLLIANGQKTYPGEWPWLVALFVVTNQHEFQCGGTILTNKHILTAGHCLKESTENNKNIPANILEVALGRFNLINYREKETETREVASYVIHPDYMHKTSGDSDLAILILRRPVEFNTFIKPICLWSGSIDLHNVITKIGYVVGWGKDEFGNRYTAEPRMAKMPIVSLETCHWSYPSFVDLTSNRTFCAGMKDGSGPCNGDSGSGLVIFDNIKKRYQLRGVVSRSVRGSELSCDLSKYIVFVDVAKYLSWIEQQISTEQSLSERKNARPAFQIRFIRNHNTYI